MKRIELTRLVKTAYAVEPSERKAAFVKSHALRELNRRELLSLQLRYMGVQLAVIGGCVLAILLGAAANAGEDFVRLVAALMPAAALTAMTGLGRSVRYGMDEIETASRFSLRMLRILRLTIIGVTGFAVMLSSSLGIRIVTGTALLPAFTFAALPYLLTSLLCMDLIRRWHSPRNLYGCFLIAACVSVLSVRASVFFITGAALLYAALPVLLLLITAELRKYVNESEEHTCSSC